MIKKYLLLLALFKAVPFYGQIMVSLAVPQTGIVQKAQLWNMVVTNATTLPQSIHVELLLTDASNGQPVLSAASNTVLLTEGANSLTLSQLSPIQYLAQNPRYPVDGSAAGLLPIGRFNACYIIHQHVADNVQPVLEQCQEITVEPVSPPMLTYPQNGDTLSTVTPPFSWIPPAPVQLFSNLTYSVKLVEILQTQSPDDALMKNIPLFTQSGTTTTSLSYPLSAPALLPGRQYAWQVTAASNGADVSESEVWSFYQTDKKANGGYARPSPFIQLKKEEEGSFAIFVSDIKFDYYNESDDTAWKVTCIDLSAPQHKEIDLDMHNIPLLKGQNLVTCKGSDNPGLTDRHLYLLTIANRRNEVWSLRFEYRKPNE